MKGIIIHRRWHHNIDMETMNQKKICFITHLPNLTGANQSLLDLLDGLNKQKYKPVVLLGKKGPLINELENRNIDYHIMGYSTDIKEKNLFSNLAKIIKSRIAVWRISCFLKKEKIDIVHNNTLLVWAGMKAAQRSGIKYICHVRELVWQDHHIKLLHEKEQYNLMENSDKAIFISEFVQDNFLNQYNVKNFVTIRDGFNTAKYLNKDHTKLFEQVPIKIVIAGRIAPGKGQLDAVKAVGYLNMSKKCNCDLLIVGPARDQLYIKEMKKYICENKLEEYITFKEFCDLKEIRAASDIELVCSTAEGLGRVTVESMLSGCLTIGANGGATPEIIKDGKTGYLYNVGDFVDLANVIVSAVSNKEQMRSLQENAIEQCIKEFDLLKYVAMIEMEYEKILC